jgi:hypothetical protein
MGVRSFFSYDIAINNCSNFIVVILAGNGIKTGNSFALQNVASIFANHREAKKIITR